MYGAFMLKHRLLLFLLAGVALASIIYFMFFVPRSIADSQSAYVSRTAVMQQFVQKTNELRSNNNLRPLIASSELEKSALAKLADMDMANYWGHYNPNGTSFSSFIWKEHKQATTVGENLARCFDTYDAAFDGLVNSPTHYKVLTGDFSYIGIASEVTKAGCESIVMHVSK